MDNGRKITLGRPKTFTDDPIKVNGVFLDELVSMGFDYELCVHALMQTENKSLESALEWLLANNVAEEEPFVASQMQPVESETLPLRSVAERAKIDSRNEEDRAFRERMRQKRASEVKAERQRKLEEQERVKELVRRDAEARKARTEAQNVAQNAAVPTPITTTPSLCRVQLRFPDGSTERGEFKPEQPLSAVLELVKSRYSNATLTALAPPRIKYTKKDMKVTLKDAGCVPSGAFAVTGDSTASPVPEPGSPSGHKLGGHGEPPHPQQRAPPAAAGLIMGGEQVLGGSHEDLHPPSQLPEKPVMGGVNILGGQPGSDTHHHIIGGPGIVAPAPGDYNFDGGSEHTDSDGSEMSDGDYYGHMWGHGNALGGEDVEEPPPPMPMIDLDELEMQPADINDINDMDEEMDEYDEEMEMFAGAGHVLGRGRRIPQVNVVTHVDPEVLRRRRLRIIPTLESLCIRAISNNLSSFSNVYLTEFLAQEVLRASVKAGTLNKRTIRAFHASQLDELSLNHCSEVTNTFIGTISAHLGTLQSLSLTNCYGLTHEGLPLLASFPHLSHLDLSGCKVTSDGVVHLARLTTLITLSLMGASITDVSPIARLTDLEHLDLRQNRISSDSCRFIGCLTRLESLFVSATMISDLRDLAKLVNLVELKLADCPIDDTSIASLSCFTDLQDLDVTNTNISENGICAMSNLTSLCRIGLPNRRTALTDASLAIIGKYLTRLDELDLTESVRITNFSPLSNLGNLTTISLWNTRFRDRDVVVLEPLTSITSLNLAHSYISDEGIIALVRVSSQWRPGLQSLSVAYSRLSDRGVMALVKITTLRAVDLRGLNAITDASVAQLKQSLVHLETLNTGGCRFVTI